MKNVTLTTPQSSLEISPEHGGSIIHFQVNMGGEIRPVIQPIITPEHIPNCGSFPLVPFSNRIKNGQFHWNGKDIQLPINMPPTPHAIHGSGWQNPWQVVEQSDNQLTIEYRNQCPSWPFDFVATQTFELQEHSLIVRSTLQNLSDESMPAGLGSHPYFTRTTDTRISADLPDMWAVDEQCLPTDVVQSVFATNNPININQHILDNAFMNLGSNAGVAATVIWPEWQTQATLSTSDNCRFLVIFSPENEDFVCVEPVTHCTDAFNKYQQGEADTGIQILEPKAILKTEMKITVSEIE